ncbi:hypothetical protein SADO_15914 [Salinisphaera dokdonensis CL-ES53]|uniref:Uncharacterized protein n=1 Tax=Salinisphaera dokdonensis CL-ES53 TaxID=1304272 RepID=A0ABV2B4D9_9GAMM
MIAIPTRFARTALLVSILAGLSATAHAHGDIDQVEDLQAHISDYEAEVSSMSETVDGIVADYESGDAVADRVDALVETWEEVEYHEAVETHAMALYPPIWIALGGLREAVEEQDAKAQVVQWQQRLDQALHQGIGALKLAAVQQKNGMNASAATHQNAADEDDDRPTITIIQDNLQTVLHHYEDGDAEAAETLLHQTYMQRFEGIEGDLIERDADLVTDLEKDFNATLPLLMEKEASANELSAEIEKMNSKLDRAQTLLDEAAQDQSSVF